jgi:hypothetical protein
MHTPIAAISLCACALLLGACDKTSSPVPTPKVDKPVVTESAAAPAGPVINSSVPSAESVFRPQNDSTANQTPARTDGTRVPSQGPTGNPTPGQNNDHSAPLAPPSRASAP